MQILAHRGLWREQKERNTWKAFRDAVSCGFGIETDVRDYKEELVVSHDIATPDCPKLEGFLEEYANSGKKTWLALNVKADGIQFQLEQMLKQYEIQNYFLFDMSIPEMVVTKREKLNFFTRHSDIESECVLYDYAVGVWLDSFFAENWITTDIIKKHLEAGKLVAVVSPEIHGFDCMPLWGFMKEAGLFKNTAMMLCTDKSQYAKEYFND